MGVSSRAIVLALFFASGWAALTYEIVWFHLLGLIVGASSISLAALLTSFMGGMAIGSAALPRLVNRYRHPLRVYAVLELGIASVGLAMPWALPHVERLYVVFMHAGSFDVLSRAGICAICLLLPTMMMGATLPAMARWTAAAPFGAAQLGLMYAANIIGAVGGTLTASFYVLRVYDSTVATHLAVAINLLVAIGAWLLARREVYEPAEPDISATRSRDTRREVIVVYIVAALSGLTALGAQVIWTRQLSLLFGATVYSFSIILAAFLVGLGGGSLAGSAWARRTPSPTLALAWCQTLLVAAIAYGSYALVNHLPQLQPTSTQFATLRASHALGSTWNLLRCAIVFLPATLLWGASFPLALAAAVSGRNDPGHPAARVTAFNTFGSLIGTLMFTFVVMPRLGSSRAQQALVIIAASGAAALLLEGALRGQRARAAALVLVVAVPMSLQLVPPIPAPLIAYGRSVSSWSSIKRFLHVAEGVNASVAVTESVGGTRQFHISGKVEASNMDVDLRLERMLGHIPALVHPHPRSVLVVGFGAGITAGSFLVHPGIQRIVICEIEPAVPLAAGAYFEEENHHVLRDPRVEIVYDDARHFMLATDERFDIITSDPIHPWVRGAATLYSAEYFELVKRHLNPGGVVTQWVPLYETDEMSVKTEIATFANAFPETTLWNSDLLEDGYDLVVMGRERSTPIDVDALQVMLDRTPALKHSLAAVSMKSAVWLMGTYAGRARDLRPWLEGAQINHEASLRLQYLAGLALNRNERVGIFEALLRYRTFPDDLFLVSPESERQLRQGY